MKKIFTFMAAALMAATVFAAKETVLDVNFAEFAASQIGTLGGSNITPTFGTTSVRKVNTDVYSISVEGLLEADKLFVNRYSDILVRYADVRSIGLYIKSTSTFVIPDMKKNDIVEIAWNAGGNKNDLTYYTIDSTLTSLANIAETGEWGEYAFTHTSGGTARTIKYSTHQLKVAADGDVRFAIPSVKGDGSNSKIFIAYIKIIRTVDDPVVTISTAQYATYYNATFAYVMPEGLEGITVNGVEGSTLTLNTSYNAGDVVPAGEALILHATEELTEATEFTLNAGTTSSSKVTANILKGTSDADDWTTGGAPYYRLSQHDGQVGFYYGAEDGAAFQPGANKAYLALNTPAESAPIRFIIEGTEVATDIENIAEQTAAQKVMINGQVFILRGEKLFDTVGRQVK